MFEFYNWLIFRIIPQEGDPFTNFTINCDMTDLNYPAPVKGDNLRT
ncbi:hypothetical protein HMPREF0765_0629 [Sphingobacterium spiritivorum ATCC 33300]|uniref:Uncharacterized protein n=1 Tax=Sphingobacterium spiritivorum ATCC 33300 TaxID=525372 RepID=C2FTH3_SPHSI|nr:hypothetical protein HMPREF0765_0629 [Sphingobacterium spiritivorum ATCC 33300]